MGFPHQNLFYSDGVVIGTSSLGTWDGSSTNMGQLIEGPHRLRHRFRPFADQTFTGVGVWVHLWRKNAAGQGGRPGGGGYGGRYGGPAPPQAAGGGRGGPAPPQMGGGMGPPQPPQVGDMTSLHGVPAQVIQGQGGMGEPMPPQMGGGQGMFPGMQGGQPQFGGPPNMGYGMQSGYGASPMGGKAGIGGRPPWMA